jgi:hypothetical protein
MCGFLSLSLPSFVSFFSSVVPILLYTFVTYLFFRFYFFFFSSLILSDASRLHLVFFFCSIGDFKSQRGVCIQLSCVNCRIGHTLYILRTLVQYTASII